MQDEPVVGVAAPGLGHQLGEFVLDRFRRLRRRQAGAVGDPEDMGVDGDERPCLRALLLAQAR